MSEDLDKREQFIDRVLSILDKPYFKSLGNMGIDDIDTQELILSKLYNDNISIEYGDHYVDIYNSNGNEIYFESSYGYWSIREYDSNGNEIYYEHSNGFWEKWEYDSNGNLIYYEGSSGGWYKREYDSNNNLIYYENSYGEWDKYEYDSGGNQIYYEDSNGKIIDNRNNNNINESEDKKDVFLNRVLSILELPYIKYLNSIGIDDEYIQKVILSKLFNDNVTIEYVDDYVDIYDSNGNEIYYEDNYGYWVKKEYDSNGKRIYFENSDGIIIDNRNNNNINESEDKKEQFINKLLSILDTPYFKSLNSIGVDDKDTQKLILSRLFNDDIVIYYGDDYVDIYNSNGKEIYYEDNNGYWIKREYNTYGKRIYSEHSNGEWAKWEYDSNGNEIYYENSNGFWIKKEYDSNGKEIYLEDSDGLIIDKRNNINESEDKRDMFVNKVLSILDTPYIKSLNSIGIDDIDTQKVILSRLFNDNIFIEYGDHYVDIYNSNGNEIYSEDSEGEWVKYEYDSKGRIVYHESSSGFWMKKEFNSKGNEIYYENSNGVWFKTEYDSDGNRIYLEDSNGYWEKNEYDSNGSRIYYEDSYGKIIDKRNNINESEI